jgi:cytidyltransferase-like protein
MKLDDTEKHILKLLYRSYLFRSTNTVQSFAQEVSFLPSEFVKEKLRKLETLNLIEMKGSDVVLTERGRKALKVVFVGGSFQIIHPGHIHTLKSAKSLGDFLVVSVARDSTVRQTRKKDLLNNEMERRELVDSIKYVDAAILGSESDIYETVEFVKPNIIALGYDQEHKEKEVREGSLKKGVEVEVVRLGSPIPSVKSSALLGKDPKAMKEL